MSQKKKEESPYIFYGKKVSSSDLKVLIAHVIESNKKNEAAGRNKYPLCIWGKHGIGKTQIVEAFAKENNYEFTYIAPAQFEEMGDLLGLPDTQDGKTVTLPPSWIPTTEYTGEEKEGYRGGILLIDDVNRADDRILRGTMQLLQNYELATWKLPKGWDIVLTANPDGGDYSVTPMDDAMLTRAIHATMIFDPQEWARWAEKNDIDSRGISFVLSYPEIFSANATRTTGRSITQFFEMIKGIDTRSTENLGLVTMLGYGCLDDVTIEKFIDFLRSNENVLISPEEILRTKNWSSIEEKLRKILFSNKKEQNKEDMRTDLSALIANRVRNHIMVKYDTYTDLELENIKRYLKSNFLTKEAAFDFVRIVSKKSSVKSQNKGETEFFTKLGSFLTIEDEEIIDMFTKIVEEMSGIKPQKKK